MASAFTSQTSSHTWDEAVREYLLSVQATRAPKTARFYDIQLRQLVLWAHENDVAFDSFGKRHLDRYLIHRQEKGLSPGTLKHDAVAAKAFFRWCARNDLIDRSPLGEYQVRNTPAPARYMPSDAEILTLLQTLKDHWNLAKNPDMRFFPPHKRAFHRDRNYAILLGLLDTACRIGEMLNLKMDDVRFGERHILVRVSKSQQPRTLPVSPEWLEALDVWLKVRERVMEAVPAEEDEGWVFISEYGTRMDESIFLKAVKRLVRLAGLSEGITLHSLRRYSLNRLAKTNLLAAQQIAGHKKTETTLLYTKLDADFVRDVHMQASIVKGIVTSKRPSRKKLL